MTLRSSIERPEALDSGSIIMADLRPESVTAAVLAASADLASTGCPLEYQVENCSVRVTNFILSTAFEHAAWAGLRTMHAPKG